MMDAYSPNRLSSYYDVPGNGTEGGSSSSMSSPCARAAAPQEPSSPTQIVRRLRPERNHSMLLSPRPPSHSICRHVGWSASADEKQTSLFSSAGPLPDHPCFDAIERSLRSLLLNR
jgi:hypothetical protein